MRLSAQLLGLLAATVLCAQAGTFTMDSTTAGGPVWNRPVGGIPPVPPLSSLATAVPYEVFAFTVDISGDYSFLTTSTDPVGWDNYSFLYQNSFSPVSQFDNLLIGNDDNPTISLSGFTYGLTAGVNYFFVETGFENTSFGGYTLNIEGPGEITPGNIEQIPEPATAGLFLLGGAGLVLARRFRRR